jgi:iron(III) transport system substrate-binding protein
MLNRDILKLGLRTAPFFMLAGNLIRPYTLLACMVVLAFTLSACSPAVQPGNNPPLTGQDGEVSGRLVVYSGRSEPLIQPVINAFQERYPEVQVLLRSGSNSEMANALLEEQANPQADVFITTELITIQALDNAGAFQSYLPAAAAALPEDAVSPNDNWVGLTRRVRVIMYNSELVSLEDAPRSILDLTDPKWKGQVATAGSTNGSMQAQIAAMRQLVGEQATEEWLRGLLENDTVFFGGHTDVRKAVGAGEFALGLVNHYYYHLQIEEGSPVGVIFPDQESGEIGLITNLTAAGIIDGSRNTAAAQALIDFLLSIEGQQLFAQMNYEYPLIEGAALESEVEPLGPYRLAEVDIGLAAQELDKTFDLIERVGLP